MFNIKCKPLTSERRKQIASLDITVIGRPLRLVLAVGGAYIFYYGTSPDVPDAVQGAAGFFAAIGIAAVLLAIFCQKLMEMRYFAKALKEGRFPNEVKAGEGGVSITYRTKDKKTDGYTEKERYCFYHQIEKIEEHDKFFKFGLPVDGAAGTGVAPFIYLFKEDFEIKEGSGNSPEAFVQFIKSKQETQ